VAHLSLRRVKSLPSVLSHLKPIRGHFGSWKALAITFRAIDSYIEMRLKADGCTPATINRETQSSPDVTRATRLSRRPEWEAVTQMTLTNPDVAV
jgi:hypothetical protein